MRRHAARPTPASGRAVERWTGPGISPITHRSKPLAQVAQLVEQRTENPRVGSSILSLGTIFFNDLACISSLMKTIGVRSGVRLYLASTREHRLGLSH